MRLPGSNLKNIAIFEKKKWHPNKLKNDMTWINYHKSYKQAKYSTYNLKINKENKYVVSIALLLVLRIPYRFMDMVYQNCLYQVTFVNSTEITFLFIYKYLNLSIYYIELLNMTINI